MNAAYPLVGLAQHYAWGGRHFIPELMRLDNGGDSRFAEWWLGAHEEAPSIVMTPCCGAWAAKSRNAASRMNARGFIFRARRQAKSCE